MFKIFNEPRPKVQSSTVHLQYPNKTYLILNPIDTFREDSHDNKIITGYTGQLYAISDETPDDMSKFRDCIQQIIKSGQRYGVLDDFPIRDSVMW